MAEVEEEGDEEDEEDGLEAHKEGTGGGGKKGLPVLWSGSGTRTSTRRFTVDDGYR